VSRGLALLEIGWGCSMRDRSDVEQQEQCPTLE
jgi:hypothetical protein